MNTIMRTFGGLEIFTEIRPTVTNNCILFGIRNTYMWEMGYAYYNLVSF